MSSFTELKSFPLKQQHITGILHRILDSIWEMEEKPADLRDATIVALFKNKVQEQTVGVIEAYLCSLLPGKSHYAEQIICCREESS